MQVIPKMAGAALLATALGAGPALATGAVVNHESMPPGTPINVCLQRAAMAIASVGMRPLNTTQSAAWGEREGGRIYTIYCIPAGNVAVFVGAGNASADVSPDITALMSAFRTGGSGGGGGGAPRK